MKILFSLFVVVIASLTLMSAVSRRPIVTLMCTTNLPAVETFVLAGACRPDGQIFLARGPDLLTSLDPKFPLETALSESVVGLVNESIQVIRPNQSVDEPRLIDQVNSRLNAIVGLLKHLLGVA